MNDYKEEIMVIANLDLFDEAVFYSGESELEAFKKFRTIKGKYRKVHMVKANVERGILKNIPFIMDYKITEILK